MSLQHTENNVKDWLPSEFRETSELAWFGKYFAGERFILATWPGCTEDDQRLQLFAQKLRSEAEGSTPAVLPANWEAAKETAAKLQLMLPSDHHKNWGGLDEKWLVSATGRWYYLTPDGKLYRWDVESNAVHSSWIAFQRATGRYKLDGTFVAAFGGPPGKRVANPYYNDPALLSAPLFRSVQTGPDVASLLAVEGGPLWPVDLTDPELKPQIARRHAIDRLTGTLYAPAVPHEFDWTAEAFARVVEEYRDSKSEESDDNASTEAASEVATDSAKPLPAELVEAFDLALQQFTQARYQGDREALLNADTKQHDEAWYAVFDAVEIKPPPRQTCVMVTLTPLGEQKLPFVVGRGVMGGPRGRLLTLAEQSGLEAAAIPSSAPPPFNVVEAVGSSGRPPLRLGGPPVDNVTIDEEGTITLSRLVGYSVLLGFGLSYLCFRSLKVTIMIFAVGGMSAVFGMAMVGWTGTAVDAILLSMPSLVYVLGLSGAIHVVNYYRDEVESEGPAGAPGRAFRHALVPCTLAAVTTAIGLMSLYTSNITPIRKFGFFSALGVLATVIILFAYLPAALETFIPHLAKKKQNKKKSIGDGGVLGRSWGAVGDFIVKRHWWVSTAATALLIFCLLGLFKIQTTVQLLKLFSADSRIINDYAWLEDNFGKLVPMELVVRLPESPDAEAAAEPAEDTRSSWNQTASNSATTSADPEMSMLEKVEAVSRIQHVVEQALGETGLGIVGQAMSTATFLPDLPAPSNGAIKSERYLFNQELTVGRNDLKGSDYFRVEENGPFAGSDLFRISLRVSALSDVDYGRFIYQLRETVEPVLEAYRSEEQIKQRMPARSRGVRKIVVLGRGAPEHLGVEPVLKPKPEMTPEERKASETLAQRTLRFLEGTPPATDSRVIDQRSIYETTLAELLRNHSSTRVLWHDPSDGKLDGKETHEQWGKNLESADMIIMLRDHEDYDLSFIEQHAKNWIDVRQIPFDRTIPTVVDEIPVAENAGPVEVVYTGVVPVVYKAQRTLLHSLVESIGWAFVLIAGVMTILLNPGRMPFTWFAPSNLGFGFAAGCVAMIPNIFPVAVVFGTMCHMGIKIDIGTMMTASVAMGVAVDDTIHFLSWFRHNLDAGMERIEAIKATYRRVGPAMTQTTIVGGLGLFVFALSSFTPTQQFGTLMLVMLAAALVGDLIFLPALLAGPLGRLFKARPPKPTANLTAPISEQDPPEFDSTSNENDRTSGSGPHSAESQPQSQNRSSVPPPASLRTRGLRADQPHQYDPSSDPGPH